ncbi:MAG: NADH-quinone oxidoreductase subunit C [Tetrasphaera sp.]
MGDERREVTPQQWAQAAAAARAEGFDFFDWLTAVDQADGDPPGVDIVLRLLDDRSPGALRGLLLSMRLPAGQPLASITAIFPGAAWHERETFEMFGVDVAGFNDGSGLGIRPLLLPDGFEGHPLRKDFVLTARVSKDWPGAKEPGQPHGGGPGRRKMMPPGVPAPEWGPR